LINKNKWVYSKCIKNTKQFNFIIYAKMIDKIKTIWEIYGVLYGFKQDYKFDLELQKQFTEQEYIRKEFLKITDKAMEWLADDDLQENDIDLD